LGRALEKRVDLVLPVAHGRAETLSIHTATLALIEALLVGVAAKRSNETIRNLEILNELRQNLTSQGGSMPSSTL
jgi:DNA-binding MurR/RpiR family transcriptional regulator